MNFSCAYFNYAYAFCVGDIAEYYLFTGIHVTVPSSRTFVNCAETAEDIDMISFANDSPMSLPDGVKIWLTSVNSFPLQILPPSLLHMCAVPDVIMSRAKSPFAILLWPLSSCCNNKMLRNKSNISFIIDVHSSYFQGIDHINS